MVWLLIHSLIYLSPDVSSVDRRRRRSEDQRWEARSESWRRCINRNKREKTRRGEALTVEARFLFSLLLYYCCNIAVLLCFSGNFSPSPSLPSRWFRAGEKHAWLSMGDSLEKLEEVHSSRTQVLRQAFPWTLIRVLQTSTGTWLIITIVRETVKENRTEKRDSRKTVKSRNNHTLSPLYCQSRHIIERRNIKYVFLFLSLLTRVQKSMHHTYKSYKGLKVARHAWGDEERRESPERKKDFAKTKWLTWSCILWVIPWNPYLSFKKKWNRKWGTWKIMMDIRWEGMYLHWWGCSSFSSFIPFAPSTHFTFVRRAKKFSKAFSFLPNHFCERMDSSFPVLGQEEKKGMKEVCIPFSCQASLKISTTRIIVKRRRREKEVEWLQLYTDKRSNEMRE